MKKKMYNKFHFLLSLLAILSSGLKDCFFSIVLTMEKKDIKKNNVFFYYFSNTKSANQELIEDLISCFPSVYFTSLPS